MSTTRQKIRNLYSDDQILALTGRTVEQWDAMVEQYQVSRRRHENNAHESFQRCDTDGFLSQHASTVNSLLDSAKSSLAESYGFSWFHCLMEGERRVDAKLIDGQYGRCFLLSDEEAERFGRKFMPYNPEGKSRVLKQHGLTLDTEYAPAWCDWSGTMVYYFRTDGK